MDGSLQRLKELIEARATGTRIEMSLDDRLLLQNGRGPEAACVHGTYESGGVTLGIDVYLPDTEFYEGPRPAVLFFFGGGFKFGCKEAFRQQAIEFAEAGYVAMSASYRTFAEHGTSAVDAIRDGAAAWRAVQEHAAAWHIDPARIALAGGSAGATIALMCGPLTKVAPCALVLFNPGIVDKRVPALGELFDVAIDGVPLYGIDAVSPGMPPMLVMHGTEDRVVPFAVVRDFAQAVERAGNDVRLVTYQGEGHGFFNYHRSRAYYLLTLGEAMRFLNELPEATATKPVE